MATQPLVSVGEIGDSTPYNVILVAQSDMRDKNERKTRAKDALKLELRKVDLCSQDVGGKPYVGNGPGLNLVKLATQLHEFQKHQEERFALQDQKIASQDQKTASQDQKIASQDQKIASQNQKIASQNQKIASQNQKITSQDRKIASQDRKITSQEKEIISDRAEFTSQKREIAEQRKKISRQEKVIGSHKGKFDRLREKLASQEEETARLRHESLSLRTSLKDYMQNIRGGNMIVHGGDVLADAMLYPPLGDRNDTATFVKLYGLEPSLVSRIKYGPTIAALNNYAYIISTLYESGTEKLCGLFAQFIELLKHSGCNKNYSTNGGLGDLASAYKAFRNCADEVRRTRGLETCYN